MAINRSHWPAAKPGLQADDRPKTAWSICSLGAGGRLLVFKSLSGQEYTNPPQGLVSALSENCKQYVKQLRPEQICAPRGADALAKPREQVDPGRDFKGSRNPDGELGRNPSRTCFCGSA